MEKGWIGVRFVDLIIKKREGKALTTEEIIKLQHSAQTLKDVISQLDI